MYDDRHKVLKLSILQLGIHGTIGFDFFKNFSEMIILKRNKKRYNNG